MRSTKFLDIRTRVFIIFPRCRLVSFFMIHEQLFYALDFLDFFIILHQQKLLTEIQNNQKVQEFKFSELNRIQAPSNNQQQEN